MDAEQEHRRFFGRASTQVKRWTLARPGGILRRLMRVVTIVLASILGLIALLLVGGFVATRVMTASVERRFPALGEFRTIDGNRLHLVAKGQGRAVVLLHGANGAVQDWLASGLVDRLATQYRVIAIDRPGHGYSDRPSSVATPDVQARLIRGALKQLGVERPILVAFSWSGALALAYALEWPNETGGIVMLAGAAYPWPTPVNLIYRLPRLPVVGPVFVHAVAMPLGSALLDGFAASAFAPSPVPQSFGASALPLALRPSSYAANAEDIDTLKPFLLKQSERYKTLKTPIAILHGDSDAVVGLDIHSRALARAAPEVTLEVVPGAGHLLHYVATERVAAAVDRLAALPPR
jgi:pimeloyl-ACP methyl ester carboxylesterase